MNEFEWPEKYLAIRWNLGEGSWALAFVDWRHFEDVHQAFENWIIEQKDRLLEVRRLSGEILHFPASALIDVTEQTREALVASYTIDALNTQLERETKRAILGHDYNPETD